MTARPAASVNLSVSAAFAGRAGRVHVNRAFPPPPAAGSQRRASRLDGCFQPLAAWVVLVDESTAAGDEIDRALVRRYLDGDPGAATTLVERYERRVFAVALRMLGNVQDAEDITQTVFGNAFLALRSYDARFRFFSWMYRMTVNESLNAIKRRKRMVALDDGLAIAATNGDADRMLEADDRVGRALKGLKPDDRAVVVLRHFVSFSYEEIAEVLEVPVKTVKSRLFTARERLRVTLLREGT